MIVKLDPKSRELLRRQIDRARRQKIGGNYADRDEWITFPDASQILGVKSVELRARARARGLLMSKQSGRFRIRIEDLDLLR